MKKIIIIRDPYLRSKVRDPTDLYFRIGTCFQIKKGNIGFTTFSSVGLDNFPQVQPVDESENLFGLALDVVRDVGQLLHLTNDLEFETKRLYSCLLSQK
jgi:hypothetical protein